MRVTLNALFWGILIVGSSNTPAGEALLPAGWLARWREPTAADRPLQIVHGINPTRSTKEYQECGLGGIVCNVAFDRYMRSEKNWRNLIAGIKACERLGMIVWLYDEDGYPSGAAGGLVLEENREYEATALVFDATKDDPFIVRPAYEHTHASNNFYAARRYTNLLDDRATRCFIAKTHEAYWKRLQPHFGKTIQATFTDEPSLITVNLGQLAEKVRSRVRVVDPVDPAVRALPGVPWCYDLPDRYRERYGEDLVPRRRSLFAGDSAADRRVRRRFWSLVADLVTERYFAAIGTWCARHGIASSGHSLWEEELLHHVPLEGNGLKALGAMHIPGLDMLSSDPEGVMHRGWMTAALPASAACLNGGRRVMTEVSDLVQKMGGNGPASRAAMQATAAWQAAWGVTEFALYYRLSDRSKNDYRAYCDYVGRLNAILKPALPVTQVLLYYPIYDLWAEYLPVAGPLKQASPSPRARRIIASFMQAGRGLQRRQIPFRLIDHEHLARATVAQRELVLGQHAFRAIVLPEGTQLPEAAGNVLEQFRGAGGRVIAGGKHAAIEGRYRLEPASERIALGAFTREGRSIVLLVNVNAQAYSGELVVPAESFWTALDPATGSQMPAVSSQLGRVSVCLDGRDAVLLVERMR